MRTYFLIRESFPPLLHTNANLFVYLFNESLGQRYKEKCSLALSSYKLQMWYFRIANWFKFHSKQGTFSGLCEIKIGIGFEFSKYLLLRNFRALTKKKGKQSLHFNLQNYIFFLIWGNSKIKPEIIKEQHEEHSHSGTRILLLDNWPLDSILSWGNSTGRIGFGCAK